MRARDFAWNREPSLLEQHVSQFFRLRFEHCHARDPRPHDSVLTAFKEDAQLLADVWLAMTRGQETLDIMLERAPAAVAAHLSPVKVLLRVIRASDPERAEHAAMCERIERESKGQCLWLQIAEAG